MQMFHKKWTWITSGKNSHMDLFKRKPLSISEQMDVWHNVIGRAVGLNERFDSPFRNTASRSCLLEEYHGKIIFSSFSEKDKPFNGWTCEKAYQFLKGGDFRHLLKTQRSFDVKPKVKSKLVPNYIEWNKQSILYWRNIGINPMVNTIIKPINSYLIQKVNHPKLPAFVYEYSDGIKMYAPYENKSFKWRGTINKNTTVWVKNGSNTLLISKSYKDQLCAESLLGTTLDYYHIQSEGQILDRVFEYEKIFVLFDNDEVGIKKGNELATQFNGIAIFTPEEKDLSEYYLLVGRKNTFKWLISTCLGK